MKRLITLRQNIFNQVRSLDRGILYSTCLLIFCGIFLIFATGPAIAERKSDIEDLYYFVKKQLFFMPIAFCTVIFTALLPVKQARRLSFFVLFCSILGMVAVLLFGVQRQGAARWISVLGVSLQPSEFAKPAFAVVCAWFLAKGKLIQHSKNTLWAWGVYAIIAGLLLKQPDLGMTLTVTAIFGAELFLSGISKWLIGGLVGAGIAAAPLAYFTFSHARARIDAFFNSEGHIPYQVAKSMETLKNAGWFGKGPGEGIVKYELPDAHTDFILAVSAEEFGFVITSVIILTFCYVIWKGMQLVRTSNRYFVQLAVGGLITQIAMQAIINMGSTLKLLPTKGMTLPFISYGGSSLVSVALCVGLILALTKEHTFSRGLE